MPHLVCIAVGGVEAEPVLLGLDQSGIAAHSGSSCSSESLAPSPVLAAMGVDAERSLRLSVGWSTTDDDVEAFATAFPPGGGAVARPSGLSPGAISADRFGRDVPVVVGRRARHGRNGLAHLLKRLGDERLRDLDLGRRRPVREELAVLVTAPAALPSARNIDPRYRWGA